MPEDIVAIFGDPDIAARALYDLREASVRGVQIASPAPYPAVHLTGRPGPWRFLGVIAICGALTGLGCAAALQVATSKALGLVVGGKPIVAWPAFGVVMFELTMLFAGVSTFAALVILGALTRRRMSPGTRAEMNSERIVVVVPADQLSESRRTAIIKSLADATAKVLP